MIFIVKRQICWRSCFNILTQKYVSQECEKIWQVGLKNKTTRINSAAISFP